MIDKVLAYLLEDWRSHPYRLVLEMFNWMMTIATGLLIALTAPHTPFLILYPLWFVGQCINIFSAISRGSSGLLLGSVSMLTIDVFGFIRLLVN